MPTFTWLDESIEHSDYDYARAKAIAFRISTIHSEDEQRGFRLQADFESGYSYDPREDCECEFCLSQNHDCDELGKDECCSLCEHPTELTECSTQAAIDAEAMQKQADKDLELELLHDKLQLLGARMMRAYEHWNEDEAYMQYQESRYDY